MGRAETTDVPFAVLAGLHKSLHSQANPISRSILTDGLRRCSDVWVAFCGECARPLSQQEQFFIRSAITHKAHAKPSFSKVRATAKRFTRSFFFGKRIRHQLAKENRMIPNLE